MNFIILYVQYMGKTACYVYRIGFFLNNEYRISENGKITLLIIMGLYIIYLSEILCLPVLGKPTIFQPYGMAAENMNYYTVW